MVSSYGYTIYCVRGNHEARPCEKLGMHLVNDEFVGGAVWVEDEFPLIHYFCDWGFYNIQGRKTLVLGGAYSVDKHYRIQNGWQWFENEQLTTAEMRTCMFNMKEYYQEFDLVLSHTCPYEWRPTDLFLNFIDQSTVDNTMELWMDEVQREIPWGIWLFGHYHQDRLERPHVEMFYYEVEDLKTVEERWARFDETGELDWWLPKSPYFYMN
jgi:3-oxoacid CoA-transferase subunit A